ncbi:unnamed protein product, partial [Prorocentrum cordatum]
MTKYEEEVTNLSKVDLATGSGKKDKDTFKSLFQQYNQATHQKFRLAAALISVNCWWAANRVLLHLRAVCKPCLNHYVREALCDLLKWMIAPLLVSTQKRLPHQTKATLETTYGAERRFGLGLEASEKEGAGDGGDAPAALRQVKDLDQFIPQAKVVLEHLEYQRGLSPLRSDIQGTRVGGLSLSFCVQVMGAFVRHREKAEKAEKPEKKGKVVLENGALSVIYTHLLPAASLAAVSMSPCGHTEGRDSLGLLAPLARETQLDLDSTDLDQSAHQFVEEQDAEKTFEAKAQQDNTLTNEKDSDIQAFLFNSHRVAPPPSWPPAAPHLTTQFDMGIGQKDLRPNSLEVSGSPGVAFPQGTPAAFQSSAGNLQAQLLAHANAVMGTFNRAASTSLAASVDQLRDSTNRRLGATEFAVAVLRQRAIHSEGAPRKLQLPLLRSNVSSSPRKPSYLRSFQRNLIYSCWDTMYDGFLLKFAYEKTKVATKQILKRVVANADRKDLIAHQAHFHISKLCSSNPIPVLEVMLKDVEIGFNVNMLQPYVECTTRCSELTADVMSFIFSRSCNRPLTEARFEVLRNVWGDSARPFVATACPVVAILRGVEAAEAVPVARALVAAGVRIVEDVRAVAGAGGTLVVSPNMDESVIRATKALGLVSVPGVATPTEALAALRYGADALKAFPGEQLPPRIVKAWSAILPKGTCVLPTGGVSAENMGEYWAAGARGFGVGTNLFKPGDSVDEVADEASYFRGIALRRPRGPPRGRRPPPSRRPPRSAPARPRRSPPRSPPRSRGRPPSGARAEGSARARRRAARARLRPSGRASSG